ncbi:circularly permutated Ras protein 1-like isoform X3 [Heterodontus francisci]|uniref:circularly permutated Ras protein 1-like isoform X3 n=1 Tax=Heterodontus francisci TaxID=7792 RepID=UPI00355BD984
MDTELAQSQKTEDLIVYCDIDWVNKMEFASSHIYIGYSANTNQTEQLGSYKNHLMESMRNTTISESPVTHLYDPVTSCSPTSEEKKAVDASFYDPVEGGGPVYGNWTPSMAIVALKADPVYDNMSDFSPDAGLQEALSSSLTPGNTTAAQLLYDVAEGSGSYYDNRRASEPQAGQHPANPPPLPLPRHQLGHSTHGQPPPLPPRPRNLKHMPSYVELIDLTPTKGPGHRALASHLQPQAPPDSWPPPLPDRTFLKHEKEELKGNINVVLVNLGKLVDIKNVKPQMCAPVYCQNCSAAMSNFSKVLDSHAEINRSSNCKSLYMSRLQAVQEAVIQSLDYLFQTSPRTRVALVTFNNEVTIYGDGLTSPRTLHDFELIDQNYLKTQGVQEALPHCILESRDALYRHVHLLQECGATALGPAALVSIAMASQKQGSKVIICTDGRANTILGNLEDIRNDAIYQSSKLFYSHLAEYAMVQGVIVSVLTIKGTDCRLPELGQLADKTGGKVNITNPDSLYNEFQLILEDDIIATNVTATFIVDNSLYFKYEDDMSSKYVKHVGNVIKDTEITFEFGINESKLEEIQKKTALPFQLQIGFRLPDGSCAYRIITQEKPTTSDSVIVKSHINLSVLQTHTAQISARLAMEGRMQDAQEAALAQKELIEEIVARKNDREQEAIYESWMQSMSPIYSAVNSKTQDAAATAQPVYEALSTKRDRESVVKSFTDDIASVVYRLKNAKKKMFKKPKFMVAL